MSCHVAEHSLQKTSAQALTPSTCKDSPVMLSDLQLGQMFPPLFAYCRLDNLGLLKGVFISVMRKGDKLSEIEPCQKADYFQPPRQSQDWRKIAPLVGRPQLRYVSQTRYNVFCSCSKYIKHFRKSQVLMVAN